MASTRERAAGLVEELRGLGKRLRALHAAAVACARRLCAASGAALEAEVIQ